MDWAVKEENVNVRMILSSTTVWSKNALRKVQFKKDAQLG